MPVAGKSADGEGQGDLYATIDVELPRDLSPDQRRLFEELKKHESQQVH
jgi:DnaJ-class molecular chaperone